jgi:hypothetical protein
MSLQIVYYCGLDCEGALDSLFTDEADLMEAEGILTGVIPNPLATRLVYRGQIVEEEDYPCDSRYVNNAQSYANYLYLPRWYPIISDLTMPTFFVDELDDRAIEQIRNRNWEKAFIKDWVKSAAYISDDASIWPASTLSEIKQRLRLYPRRGGFCVRQYVSPALLDDETRYFVLNGNVYHSSGTIPRIVSLAASRLNQMGGAFYVIDATPELIIEVNPGETSDRGARNVATDFVSWIRREFGP